MSASAPDVTTPSRATRPPRTTALRRRARRVLRRNWTGTSSVPSRQLYPHQWSWDSAFIAIGLRHLSAVRAQRELETLFEAQWGDGRVPHIVFNAAVPRGAYFPGPDFWDSSSAGAGVGAPAGVETSGLVQPPVHALAAWLVHCADPAASRRRGFLTRLYPRLNAWQRYLTAHRDLGGGGLVSVVHPWESGMDNSPCWDEPLSRIEPSAPGSFRRADLHHGSPADRPTDLDYGRYVRLAADYRDHGYRDEEAPHHFAVEDPGVNALLIASEYALADIAGATGHDPSVHTTRAERLTTALVRRLWDAEAGLFRCRDVRRDTLVPERSAAGLLPLLLPGLPAETAATLVRTMTGPHFGLHDTTRLVPSYDLLGSAFDPARYWRGPAWINVNWLLVRGLRQHGEEAHAEALSTAVRATAADSGFAEYVDPYTGRAHGIRDFSWTAALAVDLQDQASGARTPGPAGARLPRQRQTSRTRPREAQPPEVSSSASAQTAAPS
ncbi:trehalase family glycosidase [Streptomyces sp. ACA25]|uniref:MGH1-like glycoside hydrolase domain-containing protein n=1 Tax=Streptomyces sp. ACA25 TaxID=3022596 RepID=UPI00230797EE|nr:trehalase family glycosidase [Streptomyces sp. ACA25]MDB1088250.1 trehalase family glycosidase [Streptomyces sp. ACA25]